MKFLYFEICLNILDICIVIIMFLTKSFLFFQDETVIINAKQFPLQPEVHYNKAHVVDDKLSVDGVICASAWFFNETKN